MRESLMAIYLQNYQNLLCICVTCYTNKMEYEIFSILRDMAIQIESELMNYCPWNEWFIHHFQRSQRSLFVDEEGEENKSTALKSAMMAKK